METYRLSSKLKEKDREYLIQTANDSNVGAVATVIYVDGVLTETVNCPHPTDVQPQEVLSLVKLTHNEKKQEIETLLQTYRKVLDSGDPEMMYHLGTAFYYKSFYQEARELFRNALAMNSEHHQAFNQLGLTELALGNVSAAIKAATQAVTRRPRFADYHNNMGEALMAEGDVRGAIAQFEGAISVNLYYADAYLNLGIAYLQDAMNRPDALDFQAIAARVNDCLHKASLIYPGYRGPQFDAGLAEIKDRSLDRAIRILRSIRDSKKESHKQEFAGFYMKFILFPEWVSEKVIQERVSFLQQEIAKNPTYVDLQVDLAHCFLEQARMSWQKGIEHYQKSTEMNPSLTKAQSALDHVERVYQQMCGAIGRISEKG
jgi:hypothetical protein